MTWNVIAVDYFCDTTRTAASGNHFTFAERLKTVAETSGSYDCFALEHRSVLRLLVKARANKNISRKY
jgi:hypothetical protein